MRVKRYLASTLGEAMALVKSELGNDAVILHSRALRGGLFGWFGQRQVEVLAASDTELAPAPAMAGAQAMQEVAVAMQAPDRAKPPADGDLNAMQQDVSNLAVMMGQLMRRIDLPEEIQRYAPELRQVYANLSGRGVREDLAAQLVARIRRRIGAGKASPGQAADIALELLIKDLGAPAPIAATRGKRRVVALVGPTGVGKTTTLAKLAAYHAMVKHLEVGLLTADTYRIAAVEQLRTYAEIIGTPLQVIHQPEEVPELLERYARADLVLVDVAGRSHRNTAQMAELAQLLGRLHPDETYLVLPTTHAARDLEQVAEAYTLCGFDRFLFTKLDESESPGVLYNLVRGCGRPLSYLTSGQTVPDDIEVATPARVGRLILGV